MVFLELVKIYYLSSFRSVSRVTCIFPSSLPHFNKINRRELTLTTNPDIVTSSFLLRRASTLLTMIEIFISSYDTQGNFISFVFVSNRSFSQSLEVFSFTFFLVWLI